MPCIVLEYIEGENLGEWVDKHGVFSEVEALNYIQQIGEALQVVHNKGLLHRDLKPENIMLRAGKSEAVLIDFGIAREFTPNLTISHTQFISDYYSPIEQYDRRAKRDVYTDIYSLAATLYVILTKELPVPAPVRAVGTQLQPPKQLNPNISNKVNNAILQGMRLKPLDRPQSVEEWLKYLGIKYTNTIINPTKQFIPHTLYYRKNSLFWFGIGSLTAFITVGLASFSYQKWIIYQEQKVLEDTERLKTNEEAFQSFTGYPSWAIERGIEGTITVSVDTDALGNITNVQLISGSGNSKLDKHHLQQAYSWKLKPSSDGRKGIKIVTRYQLK